MKKYFRLSDFSKSMLICIAMFITPTCLAQETLDVEKLKDCEVFAQKSGFDKHERLLQIEQLEGKEITVYMIKPKTNKIKSKYTGVMHNEWQKHTDLSLENKVNVLTVRIENAKHHAYFPHTDRPNYRIYLSECLKGK